MQTQRARGRKAVDSYESESAAVSLLIRADELPLYKACVCVEAILGLHPGVTDHDIRRRHSHIQHH